MELSTAIFIFASLTMASLLSSKLSSYINMPSLLLFLAVGMIAGSEGPGRLTFDNAMQANMIGSVAMAFILFSGGFDTGWKSARAVLTTGGILSSIGVLTTALFTGFFAWGLLNLCSGSITFPLSWCLLLGSIISSTDAAAVFSILRSRSVSLKGRLQALLEFESGSNDPMAAFLTIFMIGVVTNEYETGVTMPLWEYWKIFPEFIGKMAIGAGTGFLVGKGSAWLFNKIDFDFNGLYYVLGIASVLFAFSGAELAWGNGFMAVYTAGIVMGNQRFVFHNGVGRFYDGLAWLMQVVMFTMLGLLSNPSHVWDAKWMGLGVAVFLMFIARPLSVFTSMAGSKFNARERILVSWVGLRGGAPIMLATFPLMKEVEHSDMLFNIVFFIVITSVLMQGMTIMPLAKKLALDAPLRKDPRMPLAIEETGNAATQTREFTAGSAVDGKLVVDIPLPEGTLILLIQRDGNLVIPRGNTRLVQGDRMTVVAQKQHIRECADILTA